MVYNKELDCWTEWATWATAEADDLLRKEAALTSCGLKSKDDTLTPTDGLWPTLLP